MSIFSFLFASRDIVFLEKSLKSKSNRKQLLASLDLKNLSFDEKIPEYIIPSIVSLLQDIDGDVRTTVNLLITLRNIDTKKSHLEIERFLCKVAIEIMNRKAFPERDIPHLIVYKYKDYISKKQICYYALTFAMAKCIIGNETPIQHQALLVELLCHMDASNLIELIPMEKRDELIEGAKIKSAVFSLFNKVSPYVISGAINFTFHRAMKMLTGLDINNLAITSSESVKDFFYNNQTMNIITEEFSDIELYHPDEFDDLLENEVPLVLEKLVYRSVEYIDEVYSSC